MENILLSCSVNVPLGSGGAASDDFTPENFFRQHFGELNESLPFFLRGPRGANLCDRRTGRSQGGYPQRRRVEVEDRPATERQVVRLG
jgi:hypothetical protein